MSEEQAKTDGAVVYIGCKLPQGLILELGTPGDPNYARVILKGANDSTIALGAGITRVSESFWRAWHGLKGAGDLNPKHRQRAVNQDLPYIKNGLVYECKSETDATAVALEIAGMRTGFEQLDPLKRSGLVTADDEHSNTKELRHGVSRIGGPGRVAV